MLSRAADEIEKLLASADRGKVLREGLKMVIAGRPNVGKSSLLNALLREKRAIVTDIPGTTRDVIEEMLNLGGIPVRVMDTAGIRVTGQIEKMLERTEEALQKADLVLVVMDVSTGMVEGQARPGKVGEVECLVVVNKLDLVEKVDISEWRELTNKECCCIG